METATATCTSTTKGIRCSGRCDNDGCGLYGLVGWWKEREESRERKSVFEVEAAPFEEAEASDAVSREEKVFESFSHG